MWSIFEQTMWRVGVEHTVYTDACDISILIPLMLKTIVWHLTLTILYWQLTCIIFCIERHYQINGILSTCVRFAYTKLNQSTFSTPRSSDSVYVNKWVLRKITRVKYSASLYTLNWRRQAYDKLLEPLNCTIASLLYIVHSTHCPDLNVYNSREMSATYS